MALFSVTHSSPLAIQPTTIARECAARKWASPVARLCVDAATPDDARRVAQRYAMGEAVKTAWRGPRGAVPVIAI